MPITFCAKVLWESFGRKFWAVFFWNHILNLGLGAGLGWVEGLGWLGWPGKWAVWAGGLWARAGLGWVVLGWLPVVGLGDRAGWETS